VVSVPGVSDAAASLMEVDPSLSHVLGPRAAAGLGRERVLPVIDLPAGPWAPPERDALGAGVVALAVLQGLLTAGTAGCVIGPGDLIRPWDRGVTWTACTPARLALIGARFVDALVPWPGASAKVIDRSEPARPAIAEAGSLDARLLDMLWQVASRWGVPHQEGIGLPHALGAGAVAGLLQVSERRAEAAVALLSARGAMRRGDGSGWLLPMAPPGPRTGHSQQRRDDLRSRHAQQGAIAREMQSEHAELSAQSQDEMAISRRRRGSSRRATRH
jgi:hypothetical protein